jgi:hypothetical protein
MHHMSHAWDKLISSVWDGVEIVSFFFEMRDCFIDKSADAALTYAHVVLALLTVTIYDRVPSLSHKMDSIEGNVDAEKRNPPLYV